MSMYSAHWRTLNRLLIFNILISCIVWWSHIKHAPIRNNVISYNRVVFKRLDNTLQALIDWLWNAEFCEIYLIFIFIKFGVYTVRDVLNTIQY